MKRWFYVLMAVVAVSCVLLVVSDSSESDATTNNELQSSVNLDEVPTEQADLMAPGNNGKCDLTGTVKKVGDTIYITGMKSTYRVAGYYYVPAKLYDIQGAGENGVKYTPVKPAGAEPCKAYNVILGDGKNPVNLEYTGRGEAFNFAFEPGVTIATNAIDDNHFAFFFGKGGEPIKSGSRVSSYDASIDLTFDPNRNNYSIIPTTYIKTETEKGFDYELKFIVKDANGNKCSFLSYENGSKMLKADKNGVFVIISDGIKVSCKFEEATVDVIYKYISTSGKEIDAGDNPSVLKVVKGETISQPSEISIPGYNFIGYFEESNGQLSEFDFQKQITEPTTLVLKYDPIQYHITFVDGGIDPMPYNIENTVKLNEVSKEGNYFGGWYDDKTYSNRITQISNSASDVSVYAKWFPKEMGPSIGICYDLGDYGEVTYIEKGSTLSKHIDLKRAGFDTYWVVQGTENRVELNKTTFDQPTVLEPRFSLKEYLDIVTGHTSNTGDSKSLAHYNLYSDGTATFIKNYYPEAAATIPSYITFVGDEMVCVYDIDKKPAAPCWTVTTMGDGTPYNQHCLIFPETVTEFNQDTYKDSRFDKVFISSHVTDGKNCDVRFIIDPNTPAYMKFYMTSPGYSDGIFKFEIEKATDFGYDILFEGKKIEPVNGIYSLEVKKGEFVLSASDPLTISAGDGSHGFGSYFKNENGYELVSIDTLGLNESFMLPVAIKEGNTPMAIYTAGDASTVPVVSIGDTHGSVCIRSPGRSVVIQSVSLPADVKIGADSFIDAYWIYSVTVGDSTIKTPTPKDGYTDFKLVPCGLSDGYMDFRTWPGIQLCDDFGIINTEKTFKLKVENTELKVYDPKGTYVNPISLTSEIGNIFVEIDKTIYRDLIWNQTGTLSFDYVSDIPTESVVWYVNGVEVNESPEYVLTDEGRTLTFNVTSDVKSISASSVTVSQSVLLPHVIDTDTPVPDEKGNLDLELIWNFGGTVDKDGDKWKGQSSVPLVIGDYVYVRASDKICKLDVETGLPVASAQSQAVASFYHSVGYLGNGYIHDNITKKVYDADLNYVCDLKTSVVFNEKDGCAYGIGPTIYKFTTENIESHIVDNQLMPVWTLDGASPLYGQFGTYSAPVFLNDSMYYIFTEYNTTEENKLEDICIKQIYNIYTDKTADMVISEINLNVPSGLPIDNKEGSAKAKGQYLIDDGYLTTDGKNTLYITGYTKGLFDTIPANENGGRIVSITLKSPDKISDGVVNYKPTESDWIHSAFLVYDRLGFVNAAGIFSVYNMNVDGTVGDLITKTATEMSHGSIVMNTVSAHDGKLTFYMIPYGGEYDLRVFTYDIREKKLTTATLDNETPDDFCSQNIRSSSDGKMVWYNDIGRLYCNTTADKNVYYFFINEGNHGKWVSGTGPTVVDALKETGLATFSENTLLSIKIAENSEPLSNFKIFSIGINDNNIGECHWNLVPAHTLTPSKYNTAHCYVITNQDLPPNNRSTWTYELNGENVYYFGWDLEDRSFLNIMMTSKELTPHTIFTTASQNGAFRVNSSAVAGELVTIYTVPTNGFEVSTVKCMFGNDSVPVSGNGNQYSFVMPDGDVMVSVKFVSTSVPEDGVKYDLKYTDRISGANTVLDITVDRISGTEDITDARFLIIANYDGGIVVNVYSKLDLTDGNSVEQVYVSSSGLKSIVVEVVSGIPDTPSFDYYGSCVYATSS